MHPALLVLLFFPLSAFGGLVTQLPPTTVYCGAGDFDSVNSDELGLLAVNGNVQLKNFGAGGQLPPTPFGTTNTAVVQGNAALTSVGINGGNLVVCGTITAVDVDVNGGNTTQSCSTFDFAGTNAYLSAFSSVFASLPSTGAPARVDNQFTFNVSEGTLVNIYNVPPQFFDNVEDLIINAPNGVFLVININGTNNTFADFQTILNGGVNQSTIIYNFFNASSLALNGIAVEGSVVAPAATINFTNGRVDGSMYAASILGDGGFNYAPPETPPCPIVPCPPCPSPSPFPPFSLFALSNINMGSSQCNGTLAAGGNVTLTSYAITTPNPATCPLALLAGGGITFSSGGVQGDIVSGALATLSGMSQPSTCNVTQNAGKDAVFNFDTAGTNLLAWSTVYGERPATNPTLRQFTQVTLAANATADGISVFSFPTSLFQGCTGVTVVAPLGEFVLVNVPDTNNTIANFDITLQGGILPNFLLWNFYNTSSLTIENVDLIGTVLAPQADVSFTSGSLNGVLYANTVVGEGSIVGQPAVTPLCPACPPNPCKQAGWHV